MATATPFAYNTGLSIPVTEQIGTLSIGTPTSETLLSKNGGALVTQAECQTVVNNFILRIKESQGF